MSFDGSQEQAMYNLLLLDCLPSCIWPVLADVLHRTTPLIRSYLLQSIRNHESSANEEGIEYLMSKLLSDQRLHAHLSDMGHGLGVRPGRLSPSTGIIPIETSWCASCLPRRPKGNIQRFWPKSSSNH